MQDVSHSISGAKPTVQPVPARFNDETMTLRNWPAKDKHIAIAEFHY